MEGRGPSGAHRALEIGGIAASVGASLVLVDRLVDGVADGAVAVGWLVAAAVAGYALADLLSGVVHWLGDHVLDERTPFFGPAFARPFRHHHDDPQDIVRHGFVETNGNSALCSLAGLGPACLVPVADGGAFVVGVAVVAMNALLATNQIHKWAHTDAPPRVVAWLQRAHVILPPSHHALHHAPPHDVCYCITAGWWNGALRRARVFERLAWLASSRSSPRST